MHLLRLLLDGLGGSSGQSAVLLGRLDHELEVRLDVAFVGVGDLAEAAVHVCAEGVDKLVQHEFDRAQRLLPKGRVVGHAALPFRWRRGNKEVCDKNN